MAGSDLNCRPPRLGVAGSDAAQRGACHHPDRHPHRALRKFSLLHVRNQWQCMHGWHALSPLFHSCPCRSRGWWGASCPSSPSLGTQLTRPRAWSRPARQVNGYFLACCLPLCIMCIYRVRCSSSPTGPSVIVIYNAPPRIDPPTSDLSSHYSVSPFPPPLHSHQVTFRSL